MDYRIRVLMVNYFDLLSSSNIVVSPTPIASLPVVNLQLEEKSKIMRVQSSSVTIKTKLDSLKSVNCLYLHDCNFSSGDTVTYTLYSDNNWTVPVGSGSFIVANSIISNWSPSFALANFDSIEVLSIKIEISIANSYFDCSRVFIGNCLTPRFNFSFGWSVAIVDNTTQSRTESGVLHTSPKESYRRLQFSLENLERDETSDWFNDILYCGTKKQVLICLFPEGNLEELLNYTLVGKYSEGDLSFSQPYHETFSISYTVEESYTTNGSNQSVIYLNELLSEKESLVSTQQFTIDTLIATNGVLTEQIEQYVIKIQEYEERVTVLEECCEQVKADLTALETTVSNLQVSLNG